MRGRPPIFQLPIPRLISLELDQHSLEIGVKFDHESDQCSLKWMLNSVVLEESEQKGVRFRQERHAATLTLWGNALRNIENQSILEVEAENYFGATRCSGIVMWKGMVHTISRY